LGRREGFSRRSLLRFGGGIHFRGRAGGRGPCGSCRLFTTGPCRALPVAIIRSGIPGVIVIVVIRLDVDVIEKHPEELSADLINHSFGPLGDAARITTVLNQEESYIYFLADDGGIADPQDRR